jgi:predicted DNA-binding WGR domain protein
MTAEPRYDFGMQLRRRRGDTRPVTAAGMAAARFTSYLRLTHRDPVHQRQRFYVLAWQPGLFGEGALLRSWGLAGASGKTLMTRYEDRRAAQPAIERLVYRQLRHGYRVVERI